MRIICGILAVLSLAVCTAIPFVHLWGEVGVDEYKSVLLAGSVGWFVFATLWATRKAARR
jgi:hypothetical protein